MTIIPNVTVTVLVCYLIGSIPIGWVIARSLGVDILSRGSGKIGGTNVLRVLGAKYALPVFVFDLSKGIVSILLARSLLGELPLGLGDTVATLSALIGHNWSFVIWIFTKQFRGGTGAATALGSLTFVSPLSSFLGVVIFLIVTKKTRYVSLGALCTMVISSIVVAVQIFVGQLSTSYFIYMLGLFLFLLWRHKRNITNLLKGQERKVGDIL